MRALSFDLRSTLAGRGGHGTAFRRLCHVAGLACGLSLAPLTAAQAEYWGTSLATATPQVLPGGKLASTTVVGSPDGQGVRSEARAECTDDLLRCTSVARLFVPVTPPRGTQLRTLWLRAIDSHRGGHVRATFYRQDLLGGRPEPLGQVTTTDSGHQVVQATVQATSLQGRVGPVVIGPIGPFEPTFTYYVEVVLVTEGVQVSLPGAPAPSLIAYDVGFDLDPCSSPELPSFDGRSCF